jgi:hypothetical protein
MAAPIRFLSGRNQQQKIGIEGSTENQKVLEVVGRVGIGTTIFEPSVELEVRGDQIITGILTVGNATIGGGGGGGDLNVQHVETTTLNVSGVSTFTGAADFNGSIDVDGHTELDNVNVSGVSTFGNTVYLKNYSKLKFGLSESTPDLEIYHDNIRDSYIDSNTKSLFIRNNVDNTGSRGDIVLQAKSGDDSAKFVDGGGVELYHNNFKKFETTSDGIDVNGHTELDNVNVSGVSTFVGLGTFKNDLYVSDNVYIAGFVTATRLYSSVFGEFTGSTVSADNLVGSALSISGLSTFTGAAEFKSSIDVDGHTELDNVNVSGAITATTFTGNLAGTVNTAAQPNITSVGTLGALTVSGDITANGNIVGDSSTNITGIAGVTATTLSGTLQTAAQTNITSVGTLTGLDVNGHSELDDVNVSGAITATTFTGNLAGTVNTAAQTNITSLGTLSALTVSGDITANGNIAGDNSTNITGIAGVTATTLSGTLQTAAQTNVTSIGTLTGLDVNGHTELDNVNVSGIITTASLNATGKLTTTGIGISIANGAGNTAYIEGPSEIWIDPHPFGVGQTSGSVRIRGDLYVDGTEFIVDVDKIELGDFNIGIASTVSTNSLLDGAGLGIGATSIRKFITWNNATSALMSSENWNLASGKHYEIAGTDVLTSDTLGSGVINSSLTSVGTLGALTVSGNVNANGNIIGDSATNISGINSVTATSFYGSGSNLTGISAGQIADVGVTIREEGSLVGTAKSVKNINFVGSNLTATASGVGATITLTDTPTFSSLNVTGTTTIPNISGVTTFANDVNVGTGITFYASTGIISATTFFGDGQNLNNLINQRIEGLQIFDEGVAVGTGYTFAAIDVVGNNVSVSAVGLGSTARITVSDTPTFDTVAVTNNITANGNIVGDNSTTITNISVITATDIEATAGFTGSGANLTSIPNSALTNDSVSFGGVSLDLGQTDATPAFNLSDATNYPTSSLTGTITNAQLAGSIANAKLVNDSVSFGGVSLDLGGTDATPAFDLSDATNYPTSSLTGTITNAQLAGSIANSKLANDSVSFGGVSLDLGGTDATPAFNLSDATNYPTSSLSGTITNAQLAGSIANAKLSNDSVSFGGVSVDLGASDATPAFNLSDATNYPTSSLSGTITNAQLAGSIANAKLANSTMSVGGVTLTLGATDATPAFDLSDATAYPTSSLTGTITNAQLAGSIANAKLANSTMSVGGVTLTLGATDATPAFNLSDATAYPTSSLTGTITNAQLAGSIADGKLASTFLKNVVEDTTPQLGGNLDLNSKFISGTGGISVTGIVTATSLDAAISEWVLGANGSSDYTFTGPGLTGAENDPSIYLVRGQKYNFKNSSGGHPFRIQSTPNGSTGTQYNDGITNNDAGDGVTLNWNVQFDAPDVLYYQCTSHAAMGGKIYIGNSGESIVVGAAVTINSSGINATGVVTATSFVGDGSSLTNIVSPSSNGEFYTGITSSRQIAPLSFESTVFTFPSTAGRQYVIESINVANVDASVGVGTTVNIIASIQDATAAEQTYIAYNVPIVTGGLIELLKNPIVAGPSDVIRMWSTNDGYAGVNNATEVYMNYSEFTSTDYISKFASTASITSTDTTTLYTSTSNPTVIEKIGFANRTDTGDFPISIKITNGITTSYLAKDLIIPRYSTVDILDRPKRIETGAKIEVEVGSTSTVDVIISGKKITS